MIEGDELDVTLPSFAQSPQDSEADAESTLSGEGVTMVQKVVFLGVIISAVAIGMKIKGRLGSAGIEKSLAR